MKQLIILVGLKGSGKTYIGSLMQERLGIRFIRIENIWLSIKQERLTNEYCSKGFRLAEREIDNQFKDSDIITIESTGITKYFEPFLERLNQKYNIKLIKIDASPDICLQRVKSRNSNTHIPVSDDILEQINQEALKVNLEFDMVINNEISSENEILMQIQELLI
jgi:shikimate kinase